MLTPEPRKLFSWTTERVIEQLSLIWVFWPRTQYEPQVGPRAYVGIATDDRRTVDARRRVDLCALAEPYTWSEQEAGDVNLNLAVHHVLVGP